MTPLLEKTYARISQLPEPEQDRIASVIMEELNAPAHTPNQILELAAQVYDGLSDEEIATVEQIALDRSHFSTAKVS